MSASRDRTRYGEPTVVVTGATRGIGASIARGFAAEGAAVVASGRSVDAGERQVADIRDAGGDAMFVRADVRQPDDIQALLDRTVQTYGPPDVLVNNAAVQTETSALEANLPEWDAVVETNFRGYWLCAKAAAERMDGGAIVNVSSNHALLTMPHHFPYNAVKAGIDGMTRAMALDLGPAIRVNSVNPGWIAVERTLGGLSSEDRAALERIHPVGRIGVPGDVTAAVLFLASSDASFITGTQLVIDGGRSAVMQDDTLPDYRTMRESDYEETG